MATQRFAKPYSYWSVGSNPTSTAFEEGWPSGKVPGLNPGDAKRSFATGARSSHLPPIFEVPSGLGSVAGIEFPKQPHNVFVPEWWNWQTRPA